MPAPRTCPEEFRERAFREVRTTGRPITHVGKDLGIYDPTGGTPEQGRYLAMTDIFRPGAWLDPR
ncbi:hypothetical protein ACFY0F_20200 [Streptomyces sp. NPDC001544]|uniref:hypothetical protein n=1 Tax=Streptomyces sp. NPDC001544 TaxID=3364584 RepID=UPI0036846BA7